MTRRRRTSGGLLVAAMLLYGIQGTALAQEEEVSAVGKLEFQGYCASCHGPGGKGDGLIADVLKTKPANLTQLSKKNNGNFPFWQTYRVIDGRAPIVAHGTREMPIWGDQFRVEESGKGASPESLVKGRILALTFYLESIQAK